MKHYGESLTDLRQLVEECNFQGILNENLRDQIVCDVLNKLIQRSLLLESKLMLDDEISKAYVAKITTNQVKNINSLDTIQNNKK